MEKSVLSCLCNKYNNCFNSIELIGSYSTKTYTDESDIDILIVFNETIAPCISIKYLDEFIKETKVLFPECFIISDSFFEVLFSNMLNNKRIHLLLFPDQDTFNVYPFADLLNSNIQEKKILRRQKSIILALIDATKYWSLERYNVFDKKMKLYLESKKKQIIRKWVLNDLNNLPNYYKYFIRAIGGE